MRMNYSQLSIQYRQCQGGAVGVPGKEFRTDIMWGDGSKLFNSNGDQVSFEGDTTR
jgi:hypothetical protein